MAIRITQLHTERLTLANVLKQAGKPDDADNHTIWDNVVPGLGLRFNRTSKTWLYHARCDGKQIKKTIGDTRLVSIPEAREQARAFVNSAKSGIDPRKAAAEKREAEEAAAKAAEAEQQRLSYTFRLLVRDYLSSPVGVDGRPLSQSYRQTNEWLLNDVLRVAAFADQPVEQITRKMLVDFGDEISTGRGAINRSNQLAAINRALNWGVEKERIARNVFTADGRKFTVPARAPARDRALGFRNAGEDQIFVPEELTRFWRACDQLGQPFGPMLQLLLLTGARRDEAAELVWSELDLPGKMWRLPPERAKNGRGHNIPLSDLACSILAKMPILNRCPFVFSSNGEGHVGGFSNAKLRLDKLMGDDIPGWRFHDLRRACATGMEMLGIDARVVEAVLNHQSGVKRGLVGRYQRFQWSDRKAPALALWSEFIQGLLAGEESDALIARLTGSERRAA